MPEEVEATAIDAAHAVKMEKMDAEMLKQDRTGWYSRTMWQQHFSGRNLVWLAWASRLPDKTEVVLAELIRVFDLLAYQSTAGLATLDQESRRWLRSEQQTVISARPLGRLQNLDSEDRYCGYLRRFICYTVRVFDSER